jgi:hypothetical protein
MKYFADAQWGKLLALFTSVFVALSGLAAQDIFPPDSAWSITAAPSAYVPLISGDGSSNLVFSTAWGGSISADRALRVPFPLALRVGLDYSIAGLMDYEGVPVSGSLNEILLFAGLGADKNLGKIFSVRGFLDAAFDFGILSSGETWLYPAVKAGVGFGLKLSSSLGARLDTAAIYRGGLYFGVGAALGLSYRLPESAKADAPAKPRLLELEAIDLKSVFPVLRSYYDQNPIGTVKIANTSKETAKNVRVSFIIKQYMDAPKECATIAKLEAGKSVDLPLYALFNDRILDVTEATKANGEVSVEYNADTAQTRSATVLVNDRNALSWSDDRRAAAFVSSKDPWVLDLTGNFIAAVKGLRNPGLAKNFQTAMAIHEGLKVYNLGYMLSTARPYGQEAVDSLKFPRQTLAFRSGDCADLSVLYASCLEAAGVDTAFITIPGHIFIAIDLGIAEAEAKARAFDPKSIIVTGDKVWLPIETTMRDSGFLAVWKKGAEEWQSASAKDAAVLYPMHDSWKTYAPMGLPADGSSVELPPSDKVAAAFASELARDVDAELGQRLEAMGKAPDAGTELASYLNGKGILYGKYARYAEAESSFLAAQKAGSVPALVNLGHIAMLKSDPASAYGYYQDAAKKMKQNAALQVSIAKAASALGKADAAAAALDAARRIDPEVADSYELSVQGR